MRRVLVTSPAEDSAGLISALRIHGDEPVAIPAVVRPWRPLEVRAGITAQRPQIIVVMSALAAHVLALGLPRPPEDARIVALGATTARRLSELGWSASLESADGAVGLGQALAGLPGADVALVQGDGLDASWLDVARVNGKSPIHHVAWTQESPPGLPQALAQVLPVDVTVVTSPQAARHLAQALPADARPSLGAVVAAGAAARAACEAVGIPVNRHGPRSDTAAIVALLASV